MACIVKETTKNSYIIRLTARECPTGKQAKIFCGGLNKKQTEHVLTHVKQLLRAKKASLQINDATAEWLGGLSGPLRARLESLQLITAAKAPLQITVVAYMEQVIDNRAGKKPNTIRIYRRSLYFVKQFFADCLLTAVTIGQAEKFKAFLLTPKRLDGGKRLCENTARKMLDKLKTVFNDAIKDELLTKNPFKGIASNVTGNAKRERFIEQATIEQVIGAAPDDEFALIIALARYGGLRTPSEFSLLKHGDFKLRESSPYFEVLAPKTEYCKPEPRIVPVFPELMPYVKKLVSTTKAKQGDFIFSERYRTCTEANITNTMRRAVKNAGIELWPKLFQNLRASRESELLRIHDIKDVCNWLGNTPATVFKHYLRTNNDALRKATQPAAGVLFGDLNTPEPTESAGTEAKTTQSRNHEKTPKNQQKKPILRKSAVKRGLARGLKVLPEGAILEPPEHIKHRESETLKGGGDHKGDLSAPLAEILSKWSELPAETQERLRELLKSL